MTGLEIFLSALSLLLFIATTISIRMLYKLGLVVLRVEDTLEQSLELMDNRIDSMQKILDVPLFSDSPEIKKIHSDMQDCRDSIIDIANALTNNAVSVDDAVLEEE